ncbi:hypothetical protein FRC00_006718, partial [Tulasnella sp. 408]
MVPPNNIRVLRGQGARFASTNEKLSLSPVLSTRSKLDHDDHDLSGTTANRLFPSSIANTKPSIEFNLGLLPGTKWLSLASDRPAPASPGSSSRKQSAVPEPLRGFAPNVIPPTPTTAVPSLEKLDTSALRRSADFVLLKIQEFGYAENDPRR